MGGKLYENSHSHTVSETTSLSGSAGYKRPPPSSSGPGIGGAAAGGGEDGVKKKKKGNWRNRFGPCFTTDVKPLEPAPSLTLPASSTANTSSLVSTASPSSSTSSTLSGRPGLVSSSGLGMGVGGSGGGERGLGVMGVSGGIQKSPSLLRNGSLQNSGSTTTGPGEGGTPNTTNTTKHNKHNTVSDITVKTSLLLPGLSVHPHYFIVAEQIIKNHEIVVGSLNEETVRCNLPLSYANKLCPSALPVVMKKIKKGSALCVALLQQFLFLSFLLLSPRLRIASVQLSINITNHKWQGFDTPL